MRVIRVFPRRTRATPERTAPGHWMVPRKYWEPDDDVVRVGVPPGLFDEADEVHISVTFTWDLPFAERLAKAWASVAPVKVGGPATGEKGGDFIPGRYLKPGYVITSRGCPNVCWFCDVWKREGPVRELPITEGNNLLDDNLLACSDSHIYAVFDMLAKQKNVQFTGGLEAKRLRWWHVEKLLMLNLKQLFFAYDTPNDLEPLRHAGKILRIGGFTNSGHELRAYVLCGYPGDTMSAARRRMEETMEAGFLPMAMLYRDRDGHRKPEWVTWQREWARPHIVATKWRDR